MRKSSLLALCFCLIAVACSSQKLIFKNLNVGNGLPSSEIYNVIQDHKGYVWVFTEYGIVKHNGTKFIPVCKNISLKESEVYGVCEAPSGDIFFVNSRVHIYCIRNDKAYKVKGARVEAAIRKIKGVGGKNVYNLQVDSKSTIRMTTLDKWFEFKKGTYFVEGLPKANTKIPFTDNYFPVKDGNSRESTVVNVLNLFPNHLYYYNTAYSQPKSKKLNVFNGRMSLRKYRKQLFLVSHYTLIVKYLNERGRVRLKKIDKEIIAMEVDSRGFVWLGLRSGGLIELNRNLEIVNHYFGSVIVSDILFDDENGMWVSTIGKGLFHCKNIHLRSYKGMSELRESISFIQEEHNQLFVGTKEGSLLVRRAKRFIPVQFRFEPYTISDICYIDNNFIIASHNGYWKLNPKTLVPTRFLKPDTFAPSYGIRPTGKKQLLAVLTIELGKIDLTRGMFRRDQNLKSRLRFLIERNPGEFFSSSAKGILRIVNNQVTYPGYLKDLIGYRITRMKTDRFKNIWFCTKENAVFCLDRNNKLRRYSKLPRPIIHDITFTSNNMVVLATNTGAYTCSSSDFQKNRNWKLLLGGEITQATEFGGTLFFGSKNGLNEIDVASVRSKCTYHFHLRKVRAKAKSILIKRRITLGPSENTVTFEYDFLKYNSVQQTLNYSLKGPLELSGKVTGAKIEFQNLAPGEYKLVVSPEQEFDNPGQQLTDERTIVVLPAFWQTTWFVVCCVVTVIIFIILIVWIIILRRNRKQEAQFKIERMLTEYRLTALKAQVNPHFMANSLAAIQNLILQNETDNATLYIAKFSLLLRSLLEYSNKPSASLKNELEMIGLYVELEQLRFSHSFAFDLDIETGLDLSETYIPALITQPFVENAIWHGLLPLNEEQMPGLTLKIYTENKALIISVIDNGVGRDYHKEHQKGRESKGTDLIISRIETLNQLYQTTGGRVEIIDLYDGEKPVGTRVNIVLPQSMLNQFNDKY